MNAEYIKGYITTLFHEVDQHRLSIDVRETVTEIVVMGVMRLSVGQLLGVATIFSTKDVELEYDPRFYSDESSTLLIRIGIGSAMCCGRDHDADGNCDRHVDPVRTRQVRKPDRRATTRRQDDKTKKRLVGKPVK